MRHTATAVLACAALALAGCSTSSGDEPKKTVTVTATTAPSLSAAEQRTACVDAWRAVLDAETGDADPETPAECDGLKDQTGMYAAALLARNAENRKRMDDCLADPSCTELPLATP